ncbi:MAG: metallophosphoesterase [Alphaproteobacteria bacterium]|nr:metallophosphoesterase [Alphaproteobacteria bacterium]
MRIRRRLLLTFALLALIGAWPAYRAFWGEPQEFTVRRFDVQSPSWPAAARPLRIALLSDIHVDEFHTPPERVRRVAAMVATLEPDIVLLAGDYVGGHGIRSDPHFGARSRRGAKENAVDEEGLRAVGAFSAPLGVYAVMGNHDCWWECARVREIIGETGVTFLENRAVEVRHGETSFWIAGAEDGLTQPPDFVAALAAVPPGAPSIVAVHNPGLFDWNGNTAFLQLSGHSHAGQVRFPLIGAPVRMSRYTEETANGGMIRGERILMVTHGVGEIGLPVRFGAPPEVMLITVLPGGAPNIVFTGSQILRDRGA